MNLLKKLQLLILFNKKVYFDFPYLKTQFEIINELLLQLSRQEYINEFTFVALFKKDYEMFLESIKKVECKNYKIKEMILLELEILESNFGDIAPGKGISRSDLISFYRKNNFYPFDKDKIYKKYTGENSTSCQN